MKGVSYLKQMDTERMARSLGWLTAIGAGLVFFGAIAIDAPSFSSFRIQHIIGSLFILSGGMFFAHALGSKEFLAELPAAALIFGFGIIIGVFAPSILLLTFCLGMFFVLEGALKVLYARRLRPAHNWEWALSSACVTFALALSVRPFVSMPALICVMAGLDLVSNGLAVAAMAFSMRGTIQDEKVLCLRSVCFAG